MKAKKKQEQPSGFRFIRKPKKLISYKYKKRIKKFKYGGDLSLHEPPKKFNNIVEKQKYWDSLTEKYGEFVNNRQVFLDYYDAPITERKGEISQASLMGDYFSPYRETEEFKNNAELIKKQSNLYNSLNRIYGQIDNYESFDDAMINDPNEANQLAYNYLKGYYSPEELKPGADYKELYLPLIKEQESKLKSLYKNSENTTAYTMNQESTTWRKLLNDRDDIENKSLLLASLLEEGATNGDLYDNKKNNMDVKPNTRYRGFGTFGLDDSADKLDYFVEQGLLDESIKDRVIKSVNTNERGEKVNSLDFTNLNDVISVKNAYMKDLKNKVTKFAKNENLELSDSLIQYFTLAGYNYGENGVKKMIKSYRDKGYLEDDKILSMSKPDSYSSVHNNVMRRIQTSNMLDGEGVTREDNAK